MKVVYTRLILIILGIFVIPIVIVFASVLLTGHFMVTKP